MLAAGEPGQSWPRTLIYRLSSFCLLNNLKRKKKGPTLKRYTLYIYITTDYKEIELFPLCHISLVGFAKIRIDPFAVSCFPKVIHCVWLLLTAQ